MSNRLVAPLACWLSAVAPLRPAAADVAPAAVDWMIEDPAGVLLLRLAHAEPRRGPDGGVLRVDPNRRVVTWDGVEGDVGCRQRLEAPFARVRAVRVEPQGVLRVEVRGEPRERWVFVPLPHAAWLTRTSSAVVRGFLPGLRDTLVSGPRDDLPMPASGSAAFMGAQLRPDLVPAEVSADVRLAVEQVRLALGRPALPSTAVQEALHGIPLEVSIAELLEAPARLEGRAVRVRGVAERAPGAGLVLLEGVARLRVTPSPEIAAVVDAASRGWTGEEVELAGVVRRVAGSAAGGPPDHEVVFWEYESPGTGEPGEEVRTVSVRDVVERAAALAGQTVRVVGNFRGRNLHGDLAGRGPRGAWVLKARRHAVWVTGHGPSGRGFRLDPRLVDDTTRWLEVVGTVETLEGRAVLRARRVALAAPAAFVWNGPRLRMSDPRPDVVFTLPVAGEEVPAHDARLLVQFSAYMDEESFVGRVRVLCAGPGDEAGRDASRARWSYDAVRRALLVDPGESLPAGGAIEVQLLPGIEDVHGSPLEAASGAPASPVRALRWRVASGAAALGGTP